MIQQMREKSAAEANTNLIADGQRLGTIAIDTEGKVMFTPLLEERSYHVGQCKLGVTATHAGKRVKILTDMGGEFELDLSGPRPQTLSWRTSDENFMTAESRQSWAAAQEEERAERSAGAAVRG